MTFGKRIFAMCVVWLVVGCGGGVKYTPPQHNFPSVSDIDRSMAANQLELDRLDREGARWVGLLENNARHPVIGMKR